MDVPGIAVFGLERLQSLTHRSFFAIASHSTFYQVLWLGASTPKRDKCILVFPWPRHGVCRLAGLAKQRLAQLEGTCKCIENRVSDFEHPMHEIHEILLNAAPSLYVIIQFWMHLHTKHAFFPDQCAWFSATKNGRQFATCLAGPSSLQQRLMQHAAWCSLMF